MGGNASANAVSTIAAMITPALLILGSASLVASALVRMARIVDRARVLAAAANDGSWQHLGITPSELRTWLLLHLRRARYVERSISILYSAIVVFVATCLSIALDRIANGAFEWLPVSLAVIGVALLLLGGALMVAECRDSGTQISEEITIALKRCEPQE